MASLLYYMSYIVLANESPIARRSHKKGVDARSSEAYYAVRSHALRQTPAHH